MLVWQLPRREERRAPSRVVCCSWSCFSSAGVVVGALHVKMAIVDRKAMFLGSMNLDPRSATLNTELGLIIESPELVAQIMPRMDRASGYHVKLSSDGQSVEWIEEDGDGDPRTNIVHHEEPETTTWLRFKVWLLSKFVPEGEL